MHQFIAYITGPDDIPRRWALISFDLADARREAQLLAAALFPRGCRYFVRPA